MEAGATDGGRRRIRPHPWRPPWIVGVREAPAAPGLAGIGRRPSGSAQPGRAASGDGGEQRSETVYLPTATGAENRPFAPTVMVAMAPLDPWREICPLRAHGPRRAIYSLERTGQSPRRTWGPVGDVQLVNDTEAAMTRSRESKVRDRAVLQATRRRTSQTDAAMSRSDNASSPPPSIHWIRQNSLAG